MSASTSNAKYEPLNVVGAEVDSSGNTATEAFASQVTDGMPPMYTKPAAVAEAVASPMMLEVVAPASLWEGYELEVNVGGETCTVIVVRVTILNQAKCKILFPIQLKRGRDSYKFLYCAF